jgi:hypothetical protein
MHAATQEFLTMTAIVSDRFSRIGRGTMRRAMHTFYLQPLRSALLALALSGVAAPAPLPQAPIMLEANCLDSGDGYLRATLGGAIDAKIDWPNSGTHCQGEPKDKPPGVRLSFQRVSGGSPDLLFLFGITGAREGRSARALGVNVTIIVQGANRIYGTLGDSRCTVDSLTQRPLKTKGAYRVEARGFCTQPAHAVRGKDAVLVSTFEFAGLVTFDRPGADAKQPVQVTAK